MNNNDASMQNRLIYAQQLQQQAQKRYPSNTVQMAPNTFYSMGVFRNRTEQQRVSITEKYTILGYIAAGTYGKVYKASGSQSQAKFYAIKKFKSDSKDNEVMYYTGISQSAIREMSLCRETSDHPNISKLVEIILERKCIFMVFDFAEFDLLQIIHHHSHPDVKPIPKQMLKSAMFQILAGISFLHQNWILHRDLKPANIMVTKDGVVKIGDLGLARKFNDQLQSLYSGDKVVVTIWYRSPELLLGAKHYTPAVDLWSIGCILAEMISLRPVFKGEEAKMDNKKHMPFQENQLLKILEVLGTPSLEKWPSLSSYPEYSHMSKFTLFPSNLKAWYDSNGGNDHHCFNLLTKLLDYDPISRINALDSMVHTWFKREPLQRGDIFEGVNVKYPKRKIHKDDVDIIGARRQQQQQQQQQQRNVAAQVQQQQQQQAQQAQQAQQQFNMQKRNYDMMNTTSQLRGLYDTKRKR